MQHGTIIDIQSRDYWFKVVEMLQQNWALIDINGDSTAIVYFMHDGGGVFDQMVFSSKTDAETGLLHNGFKLYAKDEEAQKFIKNPEPPFRVARHPNGRIYSSGKFWF